MDFSTTLKKTVKNTSIQKDVKKICLHKKNLEKNKLRPLRLQIEKNMKSFQQIHRIGDRYGIPNALPGESKSKSKNKGRNSLINKAISTKEKYIKRNC